MGGYHLITLHCVEIRTKNFVKKLCAELFFARIFPPFHLFVTLFLDFITTMLVNLSLWSDSYCMMS